MQKDNNSLGIINFNEINQEALNKFNTCSHRANDPVVESSCCSTKKTINFKCTLKDIFPLSYESDCSKCLEYKSRFTQQ